MGPSPWGGTLERLQQPRGGAVEQPCSACRCAPEGCRARVVTVTGWGQLSGHEGTNAEAVHRLFKAAARPRGPPPAYPGLR